MLFQNEVDWFKWNQIKKVIWPCVTQNDELDEYTEYLQSSNLRKWKTIQANPAVVPTNTVISLA